MTGKVMTGSALNILKSNLIVNASKFIDNKVGLSNFTGNYYKGGAIYAKESTLVLKHVTFHNNYAKGYGSAIFLKTSSLQINYGLFINNSAYLEGTIYVSWNHDEVSPLKFNNSVFQGNNAGVTGGALSIYYAEVTISKCKFINNSAHDGGAVYCYGQGFISILGGYYISNTANGRGGFANLINCQVSIQNSTSNISRNRALNGGAIYARESTINVDANVQMANNYAEESGGAIIVNNF